MTLDLKQLYNLLPAVYRIRDAEIALNAPNTLDPADLQELQELLALATLTAAQRHRLDELRDKQQRGPLKSLMAVLAEQIEVLQESLFQAYDDLFIETCQDWVVPYIGDLVGAPVLAEFPNSPYSLRAAVADTIANRRRKGTVSGLERIARDVTNWDAAVVEYFQLLATTQFMNHIRPANLSMADIRGADWTLPQTPFDSFARTAEVRNISSGLGKYNIPNIGIHVWRIEQQRMQNAPAYRLDARRYLFDALGRDTPLFTFSQPDDEITQRATPLNVAMPISRHMLYANLSGYYGPGLSIMIENAGGAAPPDASSICVCNLSDLTDSHGNVLGWAHAPKDKIGIDPELGRIAFPLNQPAPSQVHVSYCYGFSAEMGGGPYSRPASEDAVISVPQDFPTIQQALNHAAGALSLSGASAVIEITDNEYYVENPVVNVPAETSITLRAKDKARPVLVLSDDFNIFGGANSAFALDGLLVSGGCIAVPAGGSATPNELAKLAISHCTLAPMATPAIGGVAAQPMSPRILIEAGDVALTLDHAISGPLRIMESSSVSIADSIIDAGSPLEIAYANQDCSGPGAPLTVTNSTLIGQVKTHVILLASNTIFEAAAAALEAGTPPVMAEQLQQGCVRFSYVPPGSKVPQAYRCYPPPNAAAPLAVEFTSRRFGDPGYCQLAQQSGAGILQGADDQSEMGAFHGLYQPQRVSNLRIMLQDYLRFGLEAGIFYAT